MPPKKTQFPGFPSDGMTFLTELKANNNREWFTARKEQFEEHVRGPMLRLVQCVQDELKRFAPEFAGDPAKSIYRIYRDTRFSKDKTPYKARMAALFWHNQLTKNEGAALYFSVAPDHIEIAGGLYMPEPGQLLAVRSAISEHAAEFKKTFTNRKVKTLLGNLSGEMLSRPPKGFDPSHPDIDLLKRKQYTLWTTLDSGIAVTPKLQNEVIGRFEAMAPFVHFLNRPLLAGKTARAEDFFR